MASRRLDDPDAATLAIASLSHFATEPKTLARFFAATGLDPVTLREAAGSPGFVAGVLDFVLADARALAAIAEAQETTPEAIARARDDLERHASVAHDHDPVQSVASLAEEDWPPRPHDDWA
ncbi:DUF3572 family protein [Acuticoccus sp.]|uniref:DUF3572 family protein n=1 Tax=Acuticoccus sp. TaxID=1904378 RepID=UPI003B522B16